METAAVAVRWLHAAGAVSLVGAFASLVLVARPAAARRGRPRARAASGAGRAASLAIGGGRTRSDPRGRGPRPLAPGRRGHGRGPLGEPGAEPAPVRPARHALRDGLARADRAPGPPGGAARPGGRGSRARLARAATPGSRPVGREPRPRRHGRATPPPRRAARSPWRSTGSTSWPAASGRAASSRSRSASAGRAACRAPPPPRPPPSASRDSGSAPSTVLARDGRYAAWQQVGGVPALLGTAYGRWLLAEAAPLRGAHPAGRPEPPRLASPARGERARERRGRVAALRRHVLLRSGAGRRRSSSSVAVLGLTTPAQPRRDRVAAVRSGSTGRPPRRFPASSLGSRSGARWRPLDWWRCCWRS